MYVRDISKQDGNNGSVLPYVPRIFLSLRHSLILSGEEGGGSTGGRGRRSAEGNARYTLMTLLNFSSLGSYRIKMLQLLRQITMNSGNQMKRCWKYASPYAQA